MRAVPAALDRLHALEFGPGITHVMAVNPESSAAERTLAAVADDGTFAIEVTPGRPYVLVFIDATQVGEDMVVAIFRAETLDTLAPLADAGEADLGAVAIDPDAAEATAGTSYADLLAASHGSHSPWDW